MVDYCWWRAKMRDLTNDPNTYPSHTINHDSFKGGPVTWSNSVGINTFCTFQSLLLWRNCTVMFPVWPFNFENSVSVLDYTAWAVCKRASRGLESPAELWGSFPDQHHTDLTFPTLEGTIHRDCGDIVPLGILHHSSASRPFSSVTLAIVWHYYQRTNPFS